MASLITRRTLIGAGATAIVAAAAGVAWQKHRAARTDLPVLRVGSQKGATKSQIVASGQAQNLPYRIEWSEFASASTVLEALNANAIDTGAMSDAPFLFAYHSGGDVHAIGALRSTGGKSSSAIVVPANSKVQTVAGLKGRKITTVRGSVGHYLALRALDTAGLQASDVIFVFLAPSDSKAALSQGAVDAWSTWGPYTGEAVLHGGARIIVNGWALLTGYGFQAANSVAIADKRPLLADFVNRVKQAELWAAGHPDDYAAVMSRETGLALDVAQYVTHNEIYQPVALDDAVVAALRTEFAIYQKAGLVSPGGADLALAVDRSFG